MDTNPSLGSLTINALTAADEVIIPIDPELFALTGLQALVDTIKKIKRKLNPSIEIGGILFTKCNKRTNLYRRTYGQVTKAFQSLPIFTCQIPYTVKVGDANSYGMSVMELEQANPASLAIWNLQGRCWQMPKINPRIKSIDDLLGLDAAEESSVEPTPSLSLPIKNTIVTLPPQAIRSFRGHPFRLYEGDRLSDLVESISEHGVLTPRHHPQNRTG